MHVSIPFFDPEIARAIEPYVATPKRRLQAIERLAKAGIPVGVNVAPIIPGLNDEDVPRILEAARDAGATSAGYVLLRLPGPVKDVFEARHRAALPLRAERILHRIRETRGGKLYDARFGVRGRGEGLYAKTIEALFDASRTAAGAEPGLVAGGLSTHLPPPDQQARPAPAALTVYAPSGSSLPVFAAVTPHSRRRCAPGGRRPPHLAASPTRRRETAPPRWATGSRR